MTATTQEDVDHIKNLALEIHHLSQEVEHPADLLFALAVATAGHICLKFPKEKWAPLAVDHLKLILKMINEFPLAEPLH